MQQPPIENNSPLMERVRILETENERLRLELEFHSGRCSEKNQVPPEVQSILDQVPSMVGYWDKNLRHRYTNQAYKTWFGIEPKQMNGKHIREVIGEERYRLNLPYIEAVLRGEPQTFERTIPTPDGAQLRYSLADYIPDIQDGEVQGFFVLVSDITAVKTAETLLRENQELLQKNEELYRAVVQDQTEVISRLRGDGTYLFANEVFYRFFGLTPDRLIGTKWNPIVYDEDLARVTQELAALSPENPVVMIENRVYSATGQIHWMEFSNRGTFDADGKLVEIQSVGRDISARREAENQLRKLSLAVDQSPSNIVITNTDAKVEYVNEAFAINTGYSREEIIGQNPSVLNSGKTPPETFQNMWRMLTQGQAWKGELYNRRKDGSEYIEAAVIAPVRQTDGRITHYVAVKDDITASKLAADEINRLAFYDSLTNLPNRRLLIDRLQHALLSFARSKKAGALLLIDLDNFKTLNDTLGHDIGDQLLQQVAQRLTRCVSEADTVSRLGGDEFVVMLENLSENVQGAASHARAVGEAILHSLAQPYKLGSHSYSTTPSIGITVFAKDQGTDDLLRQADLAMYQAKAAGRNTLCFFNPEMQAAVTARALMIADLRKAIEKDQFLLHYQAQVVDSGRLTGAEVLLRWLHPQRGMVSPADFIPLAEETGLILPIGRWVLQTACAQLAVWATRPETASLTLSVNVSAKQFKQPDFVEDMLSILEQYGANPKQLKLELTENMLVDDVEDMIIKMVALGIKGVGFSLDDFGTGYSSLAYLKRLPLNQLKIDQGFVRDILTDPNDAAIAKTIVALGESLGLAVIAEGVELEAQREFLARHGCHAYQGYLFSKPLPLAQFEQFVNNAN